MPAENRHWVKLLELDIQPAIKESLINIPDRSSVVNMSLRRTFRRNE